MIRILLMSSFVSACLISLATPIRADQYSVRLFNLDGSPLVNAEGSSSRNIVTVYQQIGGGRVEDVLNDVSINARKLQNHLGRLSDTNNDGTITFTVSLAPAIEERFIVIVAQRFNEATPTAATPFILVSADNRLQHVLNIVVPEAAMYGQRTSTAKEGCYRRCAFRRRCR